MNRWSIPPVFKGRQRGRKTLHQNRRMHCVLCVFCLCPFNHHHKCGPVFYSTTETSIFFFFFSNDHFPFLLLLLLFTSCVSVSQSAWLPLSAFSNGSIYRAQSLSIDVRTMWATSSIHWWWYSDSGSLLSGDSTEHVHWGNPLKRKANWKPAWRRAL